MLPLHEDRVRRKLLKGDNLCGKMQNSCGFFPYHIRQHIIEEELQVKVDDIYYVASVHLENFEKKRDDTPLIMASYMGLHWMVLGFMLSAQVGPVSSGREMSDRSGTDALTGGKFKELQELLWHRNAFHKTALDVATEEGHDEVAKVLLRFASLDCWILHRNYDGKLPVSMLPDCKHDMFIWSTLKNIYPTASTLIWIGQGSNGVSNSINTYKDCKHDMFIRSTLKNPQQGVMDSRQSLIATTFEEDIVIDPPTHSEEITVTDLPTNSEEIIVSDDVSAKYAEEIVAYEHGDESEAIKRSKEKDYQKSKMNPKSYPRSRNHKSRDSLGKLENDILELTPNGNTILHLVSKIGDNKYAGDILDNKYARDILVYRRNSDGETPAYVAAREGHVDILAMIISYLKTNDKTESLCHHHVRSKDKHTALHTAIENHHAGVVFLLIIEIPELVNLINDSNESPIYLAAERGYYHILKIMLDTAPEATFDGPRGKTVLHAAAISGSKECITCLLDKRIDRQKRDEKGYTALQYAVNHNNTLAVSKLVHADPSIVYEIIKEDGINTSVVHIAASRGYCETLKLLMSECPECSELLDGNDKNIFHVAVENKQAEVIKFISGDKSYTSLVNQKDKNGNTPIHLLMASDLEMMEVAVDYRVNINTENNQDLTPFDMASSSEKRKKLLERVAANSHVQDKRSPEEEIRTEEEFKLVENLLIVATLIATATFAAAFTVPGGFNGNEGPKQGMPILLRKAAFKAFMVFNTMAFSSSCSVLGSHVLLLVYRLKYNEVDEENRKSIHTRIVGMYYSTGFSLLTMVLSFITGTYVVLSTIPGLAIYLCVVPIWGSVYSLFFPGPVESSANLFIDLLWSFGKRKKPEKHKKSLFPPTHDRCPHNIYEVSQDKCSLCRKLNKKRF